MNTTVFTDPEVGRFFNEHFVNIKFDMEKGEGRELSKRYRMQVFPTYLLLDAEGNEVHRVVGGHDAAEFIALIKSGIKQKIQLPVCRSVLSRENGPLNFFVGTLKYWEAVIVLIVYRKFWSFMPSE